MKKKLITLYLLVISFSCQEQENAVEPEMNFQEASVFLSNMFYQTIENSVHNAKLEIINTQLEFSNFDIVGKFLQENYFPDIQIPEISFNLESNARTVDGSHFTKEQLEFIRSLDYVMTNLTSAENFYSSINEFRNKAINATMTIEQKLEILALVEYSYSLHEYLLGGGLTRIREIIPKGSISNGRIQNEGENEDAENGNYKLTAAPEDNGGGGCSVEWRNVWAGAVVGFFGGGAAGAYAGCAGGTVVLPLVGTATGCVGGAVFGAAGGFVGGAVSGIAAELLTSCGR